MRRDKAEQAAEDSRKKKPKSPGAAGGGPKGENPYYQKNQLFIEADKIIESNCLQPFFKSMK